jgi:hypothetical protein
MPFSFLLALLAFGLLQAQKISKKFIADATRELAGAKPENTPPGYILDYEGNVLHSLDKRVGGEKNSFPDYGLVDLLVDSEDRPDN